MPTAHNSTAGEADVYIDARALQSAIFNSANFSSIATDAKGVIQIFNVGAERMLGYTAADVTNKITPANISDPRELIARAKELSVELGTPITPGFEALVFKASRGIEDIYELTYIRKDGSRFPAVVSVTALRDAQGGIIGYLLIGTDNTARKQAEDALLKAGALQSAIFNSANFSSIATDAKGVIQIFNVGAERMLGYTAADVMNKITPADISDPQEVIARAKALSVELGTPITPGFEALVFKASRGIEDIYELTYIRKDGSRFPAVVSVTALRDAQDVIIGYLLIGTDNTARQQVEEERKKLDQQLRDQQFYTRSLIESNIDALITTDPRGIITDVNKQTEALTGCMRDELIGAPFKNYFTDSGRAEAGIKRVLNEGKVTNYELTARARDGTLTVVSYNATTFYDRDRRLQGVFAAARDLTELKRFEQTQQKNIELEETSRILTEQAALLDLAQDAIVVRDMQSRIVFWSRGAEVMYGWPSKEALGRNTSELLATEFSEPTEDIEATLLRQGQWQGEAIHHKRDGTRMIIASRWALQRDADGGPVRVLTINSDITDLRQALIQAEESDRLKTAFLANMSHEVRTPLNIILGYNSLIAERLAELHDETLTSSLDAVSVGSKRLLQTIQGIIDLSRFETGTFEVRPRPVNLIALVEESVLRFRKPAEQKRLSLACKVDLPDAEVEVDPYCLEQSFHHLLDNAIKFTEQGGVTVRLHRNPTGAVSLTVEDSGVGIDPSYLASVFKPFSQEQVGYTRRFEGPGIGLTLVRRYIEANHAELSFRSEKNKGSTFEIRFAAAAEHRDGPRLPVAAAFPADAPAAEAVKKPLLLVVEDDALSLRYVATILKSQFDVLGVDTGAEARCQLVSHPEISVILMDLSLKGDEDGLTLTRWLREQEPWKRVPIIATTAYALAEDQRNVMAAGCTTFLAKPFSRRELLAAIAEARGRDRKSVV